MVAVGFTLQPDEEFLDRTRVLLDRVDYAEVAPETLWRQRGDRVVDNGFADAIKALVDDASLFAVAHGVGFSTGAASDDDERVALWKARLTDNHRRFGFQWMSDHSGMTTTAGLHLALPVAVPSTSARALATQKKLSFLRDLCGLGCVETSALPFRFCGARGDDAALVAAAVDVDGCGVVLDLHNLWTMHVNLGVDVDGYLSRLDPASIVELHVSGGSTSDVGWLPQRRVVRLDSHDDDVPEEVFALLARVAPRCPRLRGVTLERMEGTVVDDAGVARLGRELDRVREVLALPASTPWTQQKAGLSDEDVDDAVYARAVVDGAVEGVDDADGVRVAALLVAKLRFERLLNGSADVAEEFDDDAEGFAAKFKRYHRAVAPTAWSPVDEAALWRGNRGV